MYLFGAYSPIIGDHFEFEFSECNGESFQFFLNQFSKENTDEFKIIILDSGAKFTTTWVVYSCIAPLIKNMYQGQSPSGWVYATKALFLFQ